MLSVPINYPYSSKKYDYQGAGPGQGGNSYRIQDNNHSHIYVDDHDDDHGDDHDNYEDDNDDDE